MNLFSKPEKIPRPPDPDKMTDQQIEDVRKNHWKCPKCRELVYMTDVVCWKCETSRPVKVEHPSREELIKDLKNERNSWTFWAGVLFIILGVIEFIVDYINYPDEWDNTFRLLINSSLIFIGVAFMLYSAYKKTRHKQ